MGKSKPKSVKSRSDFLFDQPRNKHWMNSIREGENYQAEIPEFVGPPSMAESDSKDEQKDLLWTPSSLGDTTDTEVSDYLTWAHNEAGSLSSNVIEFAMHVLQLTKGDINAAISILTTGVGPQLPDGHALLNYAYAESRFWDELETQRFFKSLKENKRQFHLISREMRTKTTRQCVYYYHLFKKAFPYRYKQALKTTPEPQVRSSAVSTHSSRSSTRIAVRARRAAQLQSGAAKVRDADVPPSGQDDLSQPLDGCCPEPLPANDVAEEMEDCVDSGDGSVVAEGAEIVQQAGLECSSSGQSLQSDMGKKKKGSKSTPRVKKVSDNTSTAGPVGAVFPCSQCDKVFGGVKNRNAHMKYHKRHPTT